VAATAAMTSENDTENIEMDNLSVSNMTSDTANEARENVRPVEAIIAGTILFGICLLVLRDPNE